MDTEINVLIQKNFLRRKMFLVRLNLVGKKPIKPILTAVLERKLEENKQPVQNLPQVQPKIQAKEQAANVKPEPEKIVFQQSQRELQPVQPQKSPKPQPAKPLFGLNLRTFFFLLFSACSLALLVILFFPMAYYTVFPQETVPLQTTQEGTPLGGRFSAGTQATPHIQQPAYDPNLPDGNWIIIPRIGVDSQIYESLNVDNPEDALSKGIWRVPTFGMPGDLDKPIILAAHKVGYIWWWENGGEYAKEHSFYNLSKLEPGDQIEVIANHRKYVYEVYAGEEGTEITDYNADMILYTCKFLNAPSRTFRYARLLDLKKNTQQATTTTPSVDF